MNKGKSNTFAAKNRKNTNIMKTGTFMFDSPVGSFKASVRAYREYKKEWRAKMEVKLAKMEEEIRQAKADPFYQIEMFKSNKP